MSSPQQCKKGDEFSHYVLRIVMNDHGIAPCYEVTRGIKHFPSSFSATTSNFRANGSMIGTIS